MEPHTSQSPSSSKPPASRIRQSSQGSHKKPQDLSSHERIAKRAYELYEQRGRQDGHALEDWLQAERDLQGR